MEEAMEARIEKAALQVLSSSRNTLAVNLRFMDTALSRLHWVRADETGTDGRHIFYDSVPILKRYAAEQGAVPRLYLHMVMHCVFRHYLTSRTLVDQTLWDIACDMAAEACILQMKDNCVSIKGDTERETVLETYRKRAGMVTAEKLYAWLRDHNPGEQELKHLSALFGQDGHCAWYGDDNRKSPNGQGDPNSQRSSDGQEDPNSQRGSDGQGDPNSQRDSDGQEDPNSQRGSDGNNDTNTQSDFQSASANSKELEEMWKDVSEKLQMDLDSFSKQRGLNSGDMLQNLREVNREKYDYTEFLKKFAVMTEVMKINDDEFDYIFYTYGLSLFPEKRMPLIEPLEYKDQKRIREFVIAIDTSGSVSGPLVQTFVQKTFNILKSTESFATRVNLHILQCDAQVQEHVKITTQEEFDYYIKHMKLKGFGGTDFRPVFDTVDQMIKDHEFTNLRGLIYFTDGYGAFPVRKPAYQSAFVFVDDDYRIPEVPAWAIRLVLQKEEI